MEAVGSALEKGRSSEICCIVEPLTLTLTCTSECTRTSTLSTTLSLKVERWNMIRFQFMEGHGWTTRAIEMSSENWSKSETRSIVHYGYNPSWTKGPRSEGSGGTGEYFSEKRCTQVEVHVQRDGFFPIFSKHFLPAKVDQLIDVLDLLASGSRSGVAEFHEFVPQSRSDGIQERLFSVVLTWRTSLHWDAGSINQ